MTAASPVRIAARLYECRDAARVLLGAKFKAKMQDYGEAIKQVAEAKGISELAAAQEMASLKDIDPGTAIIVLAAAVELVEPGTL